MYVEIKALIASDRQYQFSKLSQLTSMTQRAHSGLYGAAGGQEDGWYIGSVLVVAALRQFAVSSTY